MAEKNSDTGYYPKSADELRFYLKHLIKTLSMQDGTEDDKVFKASHVKTYDRKKDRHGYNPGEDRKVYEATYEKDGTVYHTTGKTKTYRHKDYNTDPRKDRSIDDHYDRMHAKMRAGIAKAHAEEPVPTEPKKKGILARLGSKLRGEEVEVYEAKVNEASEADEIKKHWKSGDWKGRRKYVKGEKGSFDKRAVLSPGHAEREFRNMRAKKLFYKQDFYGGEYSKKDSIKSTVKEHLTRIVEEENEGVMYGGAHHTVLKHDKKTGKMTVQRTYKPKHGSRSFPQEIDAKDTIPWKQYSGDAHKAIYGGPDESGKHRDANWHYAQFKKKYRSGKKKLGECFDLSGLKYPLDEAKTRASTPNELSHKVKPYKNTKELDSRIKAGFKKKSARIDAFKRVAGIEDKD